MLERRNPRTNPKERDLVVPPFRLYAEETGRFRCNGEMRSLCGRPTVLRTQDEIESASFIYSNRRAYETRAFRDDIENADPNNCTRTKRFFHDVAAKFLNRFYVRRKGIARRYFVRRRVFGKKISSLSRQTRNSKNQYIIFRATLSRPP